MEEHSNLRPYKKDSIVKFPLKMVADLQFGLDAISMRIVVAIIHGLSHSDELFPWKVKIDEFAHYIGQSNRSISNKRKIIENALDSINNTPLRVAGTQQDWMKYPWFTSYGIRDKYVTFSINSEIKKYLIGFKQYIPFLLETSAEKFKGKYTHMMYLKFKKHLSERRGTKVGVVELLISDIILDLRIEDKKWVKGKNFNQHFFQQVIGICKPRGTDTWKYFDTGVTVKNGVKIEYKTTMCLEEINTKSDLLVQAEPLKTGKKYDRILFTIRSKEDIKAGIDLEKLLKESEEIIPEQLHVKDNTLKMKKKKFSEFSFGQVAITVIKGVNENVIRDELTEEQILLVDAGAKVQGYEFKNNRYIKYHEE